MFVAANTRGNMLTTLRRGVTPTTRIVQRGQRSTKVVSKTAEQPIIETVSLDSYAASRRTFDTTTFKAMSIGGLAGLCGSLAGMGGGFIMIPLMTSKYMLRLSQHQAHGTSLFAITTTGLAGALGYSGQVDYEAAAAIACTGMVTARIGAMATSMLSGVMLRRGLGLLMLCVSPLLPANAYLKQETAVDAEGKPERSIVQRVVVPAMIGSFSGLLAGLFGVGGGAIVVPALTVATDMNHYQALGTSLCAMTLPALVGTVTHYGKGNVAMRVAPALAVGAFMGGFIGGNLGQNIDESKLQFGFSCLMLFLGGKTFLL